MEGFIIVWGYIKKFLGFILDFISDPKALLVLFAFIAYFEYRVGVDQRVHTNELKSQINALQTKLDNWPKIESQIITRNIYIDRMVKTYEQIPKDPGECITPNDLNQLQLTWQTLLSQTGGSTPVTGTVSITDKTK